MRDSGSGGGSGQGVGGGHTGRKAWNRISATPGISQACPSPLGSGAHPTFLSQRKPEGADSPDLISFLVVAHLWSPTVCTTTTHTLPPSLCVSPLRQSSLHLPG